LDALVEGFPRGKRWDLFGRNLDGVPRARVASRPSLAVTELEAAKASHVHPLPRLQRRHNGLQELGDYGFRLVLGHLHGGRDLIDELCLGHTSLSSR